MASAAGTVSRLPDCYWELEAAWWALEARRFGSAYRRSLRLRPWRRLWWALLLLP